MRKLIVLFLSLTVLISACGEKKNDDQKPVEKLPKTENIDNLTSVANRSLIVIPPENNKSLEGLSLNNGVNDLYTSNIDKRYPYRNEEYPKPFDIEMEPANTDLKCLWATRGKLKYAKKDGKYMLIIDMPEQIGHEYLYYNSKIRVIDPKTGKTFWEFQKYGTLEDLDPYLTLAWQKRFPLYDSQFDIEYFLSEDLYFNFNTGEILIINDGVIKYVSIPHNIEKDLAILKQKKHIFPEHQPKIIYVGNKNIVVFNAYYDDASKKTLSFNSIFDKTSGKEVFKTDGPIEIDTQRNNFYLCKTTAGKSVEIACYDLDSLAVVWTKTIYKKVAPILDKEGHHVRNTNIYFWGNVAILQLLNVKKEYHLFRFDPENGDLIWEAESTGRISFLQDTYVCTYDDVSNINTIFKMFNGEIQNTTIKTKTVDEKPKIETTRSKPDLPDNDILRITYKNINREFPKNEWSFISSGYDHNLSYYMFMFNLKTKKLTFFDMETFDEIWSIDDTLEQSERINYFKVSKDRIYCIQKTSFIILEKNSGKQLFIFNPTSSPDISCCNSWPEVRCEIDFYKSFVILTTSLGTYCFSENEVEPSLSIFPYYTRIEVPTLCGAPHGNTDEEREEYNKKYESMKKNNQENPPELEITNIGAEDIEINLVEDKNYLKLETNNFILKPGETKKIKVWMSFDCNLIGEIRIKWLGRETCVTYQTTPRSCAD